MITRLSQRLRSACIIIFLFVMVCLASPRLAFANTAPKSLASLTPGSIVKIRENGVLHDFIVIKHGYPTSSNGRTLLLRKNIINKQPWNSTELTEYDCGYSGSTIDTWLSSTYYTYLDSYVQNEVTNVTIRASVDLNTANISRKVFLLSSSELFASEAGEGGFISVFSDKQYKIAYSDADPSTALEWWTRTQEVQGGPNGPSFRLYWVMAGGGLSGELSAKKESGVRPALTLLSSNAVDADGAILEGHVPGAPSNLTVSVGTDVQISWDASVDDDNDARYILERSLDDGSTWSVISTQADIGFTDQLQDEWSSVKYRVKAYDALSAESEYVTSSTYPLSTVISSIQATGQMMYTGGDTQVSIKGVHLPDGIQVSLFLGEDSVVSGTTTGSGTMQTATLTVPANASETDNAIYTVRISLDGGSTWEDTAATIIVQRNSPTVISELNVSPETLPTSGGIITVSVTGTNLYDNIMVSAGPDISGITTGNETEQSVSLTLPANTGVEDIEYTVKASLDAGQTWNGSTASVTVMHEETPPETEPPVSTPSTLPTATPSSLPATPRPTPDRSSSTDREVIVSPELNVSVAVDDTSNLKLPKTITLTESRPVKLNVKSAKQDAVTYQWYMDGAPITGASKASLIVNQEGVYQVALTTAHSSGDETTVYSGFYAIYYDPVVNSSEVVLSVTDNAADLSSGGVTQRKDEKLLVTVIGNHQGIGAAVNADKLLIRTAQEDAIVTRVIGNGTYYNINDNAGEIPLSGGQIVILVAKAPTENGTVTLPRTGDEISIAGYVIIPAIISLAIRKGYKRKKQIG